MIYKEIENYEGYFVSDTGKILSTNYLKGTKTKELAQTISKNGYYQVHIRNKLYYAHRLVAMAFLLEKLINF